VGLLSGAKARQGSIVQKFLNKFRKKTHEISELKAIENFERHQIGYLALIHLAVIRTAYDRLRSFLEKIENISNPLLKEKFIQRKFAQLPNLKNHIGLNQLTTLKELLKTWDKPSIDRYQTELFREVIGSWKPYFTETGYSEFTESSSLEVLEKEINKLLDQFTQETLRQGNLSGFERFINNLQHNNLRNSTQRIQTTLENLPRPKYFAFLGKVKDAQPEHFLSNRIDSFRPFYYYRPYLDQKIHTVILSAKEKYPRSVVIKGESLSGKTRAAYEAIKHESFLDWNLMVIYPGDIGPDFKVYDFQDDKPVIAFIDEMDTFISQEGALTALMKLRDRRVVVVATCRLGP
ncbi:MAG: hypothetical protein AAGM67_18150, partial [Bacteroidota bacterium]